jgi:hypothetical protein
MDRCIDDRGSAFHPEIAERSSFGVVALHGEWKGKGDKTAPSEKAGFGDKTGALALHWVSDRPQTVRQRHSGHCRRHGLGVRHFLPYVHALLD